MVYIPNVVVVRDANGELKHYGIKGMKWDKDRVEKKTDKLEKLVTKTVDRRENKSGIRLTVTDEDLTSIEAKVQIEKEKVDKKIAKAQEFVDKQKKIMSSNSPIKILAPEKKRKAVEQYLASLKMSSTTLSKLKTQMSNIKRKTKQPMR